MPVGPDRLYVYWDIAEVEVSRWELTARRSHDNAILHRFSVPGFGGEGWVAVLPDTHGTVTLEGDIDGEMHHVATVTFATPPTGPSEPGPTRWVRLSGDGMTDAQMPEGAQTPLSDRGFGTSGHYGTKR